MRASHITADNSRSVIIEVFNLIFSIASEEVTLATRSNRINDLIQFAHRGALGLESFDTSVFGSNSMAIVLLDTRNSLKSIARNNSLTIELSGRITTGTPCR